MIHTWVVHYISAFSWGERERREKFTRQIRLQRNLKLLHTFRRGERGSEQVERNKFTPREIPPLLVSLACLFVSCPVCRTNELYFPLPWRRPRYAPQFSSVEVEDFGGGRQVMTKHFLTNNECVYSKYYSKSSKPRNSFFELDRIVAVLSPPFLHPFLRRRILNLISILAHHQDLHQRGG